MLFYVMLLHYGNVIILHYDIMLGEHNYVPFHYANVIVLHCANVIMLLYVYVCRQTCMVCICIRLYVLTSIFMQVDMH